MEIRRIPELKIPGVYDSDEGKQRIDTAHRRRRDQLHATKQGNRRRNRQARSTRRHQR